MAAISKIGNFRIHFALLIICRFYSANLPIILFDKYQKGNMSKYVVNLHAIYLGFNVFLVLCKICEKSARGYFDLRCVIRNGGHIYSCN